MARALLTIGYHWGEIEWGRMVLEEYHKRKLPGRRNIVFHEIKDSDVETGDISEKVNKHVDDIIAAERCDLWIDIHCGFNPKYNHGKILLHYDSIDKELLKAASEIAGVNINDLGIIPIEYRVDVVPTARADPFFSSRDIRDRTAVYWRAMERTLCFINQIYDIHA